MITKREITETAFRLFARNGFHETSMENIANSLGIKKQSLYSHYKNKEEIILSVLQAQTEEIKTALDALIRAHCCQPIDRLLKFFFIRVTLFLSDRERLLLIKRVYLYYEKDALNDFLSQAIKQLDVSVRRSLSEMLTEKCAAFRNPEKLQSFLMSYMVTIQGYLDIILMTGYNLEMAESVWDSFWNGVKALTLPSAGDADAK